MMYQLNPLLEVINPVITIPSTIGALSGGITGYGLSKIDNKELKELKEKDPELYKKLKKKRSLKYTLAGTGIGLGAGLTSGIGFHEIRKRNSKGVGYLENFDKERFELYKTNPLNGIKEIDPAIDNEYSRIMSRMSDVEAIEPNLKKNRIASFRRRPNYISLTALLNGRAPNGKRRKLIWATFKGAPNPDLAIERLKEIAEKGGDSINPEALKQVRQELVKRYNYFS